MMPYLRAEKKGEAEMASPFYHIEL